LFLPVPLHPDDDLEPLDFAAFEGRGVGGQDLRAAEVFLDDQLPAFEVRPGLEFAVAGDLLLFLAVGLERHVPAVAVGDRDGVAVVHDDQPLADLAHAAADDFHLAQVAVFRLAHAAEHPGHPAAASTAATPAATASAATAR